MSSQEQGRQSPDPETQTGAQQQDPPSNAKGVNDSENPESNKETSKKELEGFSSNPKGPLDDEVTKKFSKTTGES